MTYFMHSDSVLHLQGWAHWLYFSCLSGNTSINTHNSFFGFGISDVKSLFLFPQGHLNHDSEKKRPGTLREESWWSLGLHFRGNKFWPGGRLQVHSVIGSKAFQGLNVTLANSMFLKVGQSHASDKSCEKQARKVFGNYLRRFIFEKNFFHKFAYETPFNLIDCYLGPNE